MCFGGGGGPERGTPTSSGRSTSSSGRVSSSPRPQPRPDTSSSSYRARQAVSTAASNLSRDVSMGAATFGRSEAAGNAALAARGYSQSEIQSYRDRTAATQERARQAEAQAAAMREQGRSDEQPQRPTSTINTGGAATPAPTPAPTPTPVVPVVPVAPPPVGETPEAFVPGPTETAVVEEAKKKTGYAGTIETTPSGLMTEAKTRKKRSLMGGLLAS